ncbi:hypothetical protein V8E53_006212 [Lactarius tabidus]
MSAVHDQFKTSGISRPMNYRGCTSPVVALKSLSSSQTAQSRLEASVVVGLTLEGLTHFALVPVKSGRYPSRQATYAHACGRHMTYRQPRTPTQGMCRHCHYSALPSQVAWLLGLTAMLRDSILLHAAAGAIRAPRVEGVQMTLLSFLQTQVQDRTTVANGIRNFLNTTYIQRLDTKIEGGKPDPQYNVYAMGQLIPNDALWYEIRAYLKGRIYKSSNCGRGKAKEKNYSCGLCHGCDHPRGLCLFPKVQGWNGGGNRTPAKDTQAQPMRRETETRRTQKRPYNTFQSGQQAGPSKPRRSFGHN